MTSIHWLVVKTTIVTTENRCGTFRRLKLAPKVWTVPIDLWVAKSQKRYPWGLVSCGLGLYGVATLEPVVSWESAFYCRGVENEEAGAWSSRRFCPSFRVAAQWWRFVCFPEPFQQFVDWRRVCSRVARRRCGEKWNVSVKVRPKPTLRNI